MRKHATIPNEPEEAPLTPQQPEVKPPTDPAEPQVPQEAPDVAPVELPPDTVVQPEADPTKREL